MSKRSLHAVIEFMETHLARQGFVIAGSAVDLCRPDKGFEDGIEIIRVLWRFYSQVLTDKPVPEGQHLIFPVNQQGQFT